MVSSKKPSLPASRVPHHSTIAGISEQNAGGQPRSWNHRHILRNSEDLRRPLNVFPMSKVGDRQHQKKHICFLCDRKATFFFWYPHISGNTYMEIAENQCWQLVDSWATENLGPPQIMPKSSSLIARWITKKAHEWNPLAPEIVETICHCFALPHAMMAVPGGRLPLRHAARRNQQMTLW